MKKLDIDKLIKIGKIKVINGEFYFVTRYYARQYFKATVGEDINPVILNTENGYKILGGR